jgi:hypothetical protein
MGIGHGKVSGHQRAAGLPGAMGSTHCATVPLQAAAASDVSGTARG